MNGNESSPPSSSSASDDDGASNAASRVSRAAPSALDERQSCSALLRAAVRNPDQLTAMISNYSTSYNAVNVGIALPVLNFSVASNHNRSSEQRHPYSSPSSSDCDRYYLPASTSTAERALGGANEDEQDSLVASSLMAGMIVGQLIGGVLGDVLGRRRAMMLVLMLQIGGSLGGALLVSTEDGGPTALEQLAIWRFVLGIGAGGV
jgi:MFS family permease